jgi:hypothetical protein
MKTKKYCYAILPHAGLGNKLFIWAQCVLFAKQNNCKYAIKGWAHLHIRTLLKVVFFLEKRHEYYFSPFKYNLLDRFSFLFFNIKNAELITQSHADKIKEQWAGNYYFKGMNHPEYFLVLRDYRELIIKCFWERIKEKYIPPKKDANEIGIHIRRGDFVTLGMETPIEYFKESLKLIRGYLGYEVRAKVYSNGSKDVLENILNEPNVEFHEPKNPMYDLISLSSSKIIILSVNSTFGMWAAFLSKAIIIRNNDDYEKGFIRSESDRGILYEGSLDSHYDQWPDLLKSNLDKLK